MGRRARIERKAMKVLFLRVQNSQAKLKRLTQVIYELFCAGRRVVIAVEGSAAAGYLDDCLWRLPEEGFLPHERSDVECKAPVVITEGTEVFGGGQVLVNLREQPHPNIEKFEEVYQLFDETSEQRHQQSLKQYRYYQTCGYEIVDT
jgi:DNA polymerase-3 subunit chi